MAPARPGHRGATRHRHRPLPSRQRASLLHYRAPTPASKCRATRPQRPPVARRRRDEPASLFASFASRAVVFPSWPEPPREPRCPRYLIISITPMPLQESVLRSPAGELLTWIARLSCSEPLTRLYLAPRCTDCATTRHREAAAAAGESILNNSSRPYKVASIAQQCMRPRAIVTNTHTVCLAATLIPARDWFLSMYNKKNEGSQFFFPRLCETTRPMDRSALEKLALKEGLLGSQRQQQRKTESLLCQCRDRGGSFILFS